jgi:hypothetical protein
MTTVLLTESTDEGVVEGNSVEVVSGITSEDVVSGEAVLKETNSEEE